MQSGETRANGAVKGPSATARLSALEQDWVRIDLVETALSELARLQLPDRVHEFQWMRDELVRLRSELPVLSGPLGERVGRIESALNDFAGRIDGLARAVQQLVTRGNEHDHRLIALVSQMDNLRERIDQAASRSTVEALQGELGEGLDQRMVRFAEIMRATIGELAAALRPPEPPAPPRRSWGRLGYG